MLLAGAAVNCIERAVRDRGIEKGAVAEIMISSVWSVGCVLILMFRVGANERPLVAESDGASDFVAQRRQGALPAKQSLTRLCSKANRIDGQAESAMPRHGEAGHNSRVNCCIPSQQGSKSARSPAASSSHTPNFVDRARTSSRT